MKITVNEKSYGVVELYDAIAKQLGKDPEKCSYDCRKIIAKRIIRFPVQTESEGTIDAGYT